MKWNNFNRDFFIGICVKNLKNISLMKKAINELIEQTEIKSEINPFDNSKDLISKSENDYKGKIEFKNVTFSSPTNKKHIKKYIIYNKSR